ncbi:large ribosomal subunit protein mL49 [Bacillus rossius redtenbacheri]|uniref:large ribosomal subunit protein mL49 n=1 Tax=Bacillus rossius redtenbacheri TaxID=93214 RepID=UPI002FDE6695
MYLFYNKLRIVIQMTVSMRSVKSLVRSFCSLSRCSKISINHVDRTLEKKYTAVKIMKAPPIRYGSYLNSKPAADVVELPEFEVSKSPDEWKYVERLLPLKTVPKPKPKTEYPSGWKPQSEAAKDLPYFIKRNKNHMVPVYLYRGHLGHVRITQVKHIQGDIWALGEELKSFLAKENNKLIQIQVQEVYGHINIRGDYVTQVYNWLLNKGF